MKPLNDVKANLAAANRSGVRRTVTVLVVIAVLLYSAIFVRALLLS